MADRMLISTGTYSGSLMGWKGKEDAPPTRAKDLELQYAFSAHDGVIRCLAVDQGGKTLVTGGEDESVRIFNLKRGKEVGTLMEHEGEVTSLEFIGSSHLLSGGADSTICIWRCSDWVCLHKMGGHKGPIHCVAVHPTGRLALSTAKDQTLRMWDLVKGRCAFVSRLPEDGSRVLWSPDTTGYAVLFRSSVSVYNTAGEVTAALDHPVRLNDIAFLPSGVLVTGDDDSVLRMFTIHGDLIRTVKTEHLHRVRSLAVSSDLNRLISQDTDGLTFVWDCDALVEPTDDPSAESNVKPLFTLNNAAGNRTTCVAVYPGVQLSAQPVKLPAKKKGTGAGVGAGGEDEDEDVAVRSKKKGKKSNSKKGKAAAEDSRGKKSSKKGSKPATEEATPAAAPVRIKLKPERTATSAGVSATAPSAVRAAKPPRSAGRDLSRFEGDSEGPVPLVPAELMAEQAPVVEMYEPPPPEPEGPAAGTAPKKTKKKKKKKMGRARREELAAAAAADGGGGGGGGGSSRPFKRRA